MTIRKRETLSPSMGQPQAGLSKIEIHDMHCSKPYRPYDVRCDKPSPLSNKFWHGYEHERDIACDNFQTWFEEEVLTHRNWTAFEELMRLRWLYRKHGCLRIFCWCVPKRCHTETIARWLEANS